MCETLKQVSIKNMAAQNMHLCCIVAEDIKRAKKKYFWLLNPLTLKNVIHLLHGQMLIVNHWNILVIRITFKCELTIATNVLQAKEN